MTSREWLNLGLAALFLFYVIYITWLMIPQMECWRIGGDYCQYLSGGRLANNYGYSHIYDLWLPVQAAANSSPTSVMPFPYLPVFVLPFQLLSKLRPEIGFWTWTALNLAALFLYLRSFARRLNIQPVPDRLLLMIFACLPVYMNVLNGQVNMWLVICVGEFMVAFFSDHPFRAGLWLAGLLLKPQMLILIGLILLLRRSWQILAGLGVSSFAFGILSFLMIGPAGLVQMLKIWLGTANAQAGVWEAGMMNWRMLGVHLSSITNPWIGLGFAIAGVLATLIVALYKWGRPLNPALQSFPVALLGILAATALVTWHAHIHEAVILIPPLVYLYQKKILPQKVLDYWVFLPAFLFLIMVFIPEATAQLGIFSGDIRPFIYFVIGAGEFSVNFYLFWWAVRTPDASLSHPNLPGVA
jgi:hypothetical protein